MCAGVEAALSPGLNQGGLRKWGHGLGAKWPRQGGSRLAESWSQPPPIAWSSHHEHARALVHRASQWAYSQRSEAFGAALRVPGEGQVLVGGIAQAS